MEEMPRNLDLGGKQIVETEDFFFNKWINRKNDEQEPSNNYRITSVNKME